MSASEKSDALNFFTARRESGFVLCRKGVRSVRTKKKHCFSHETVLSGASGHLISVGVALAAVVDAGFMAFMAFRAGKDAFVLSVRVDLEASVGFLDHVLVAPVTIHAAVEVTGLFYFEVGRMAGFALASTSHMAVGEELPLSGLSGIRSSRCVRGEGEAGKEKSAGREGKQSGFHWGLHDVLD